MTPPERHRSHPPQLLSINRIEVSPSDACPETLQARPAPVLTVQSGPNIGSKVSYAMFTISDCVESLDLEVGIS